VGYSRENCEHELQLGGVFSFQGVSMPMLAHQAGGSAGPAMELIRLGGSLKDAETVIRDYQTGCTPRGCGNHERGRHATTLVYDYN